MDLLRGIAVGLVRHVIPFVGAGVVGVVMFFAISGLRSAAPPITKQPGSALTYLAGGPVIAVSTCVLLIAWRGWTDVRAPALWTLVVLGTLSYGGYLWNYPINLWLHPLDLPGTGLHALALALGAGLSWRFVERRFQAPSRAVVAM